MVNYQILNLRWELLLGKEGGLGWAIGYICDVSLFNLGCGHVDVLLYYSFFFFFCHSVVSDSLWPRELQHVRLPCPLLSPGVCSNSCPSSRWCHPTSSSSIVPFSSAFNLSQHQGLFQGVGSSYQMTKVLGLQLQHQSFQWIFRVDFL